MERRGGSGYLYKKGPAQSRSQSPAPGSGTMELSELLGVGIKDIANGSSDTSLSGLNMTFDNNGGAEGFTGAHLPPARKPRGGGAGLALRAG